ncbi:MAG TPA: OsmC family protein [Thermoplasmata archaeon]|nr:OsmC family protein [Thermoplasmata archaeon]
MEAHAVWQHGFALLLNDGREHATTVDLPADEGGGNTGTSSLELCVLSLAGCIGTIFAIIARKRRLVYSGLEVALTADRPPNAATVERVAGTVDVRSGADREDLETVLRMTLKTCPVGVLFERARVPVDVRLRLLPA